jgi:ankyrin repeat protein
LKRLIEKGESNFECKSADGTRPIHMICANSSIELVKIFIEMDVDLQPSDNNGWRPIHYVCARKNLELLELFIDKVDLECKTNDGYSPIEIAKQYCFDEKFVEFLSNHIKLQQSQVDKS